MDKLTGADLMKNFESGVPTLFLNSTNQKIFEESHDFSSPFDRLNFRVEKLLYSENYIRDWLQKRSGRTAIKFERCAMCRP